MRREKLGRGGAAGWASGEMGIRRLYGTSRLGSRDTLTEDAGGRKIPLSPFFWEEHCENVWCDGAPLVSSWVEVSAVQGRFGRVGMVFCELARTCPAIRTVG